ncbi:GAF domain-containing protein [Sphaerimonospora sp. CA-214678]|uniref:GAF domain-containing protein n=1 Tax=Sphaerimonospora sp. CA-214678 TaxID=3240029 RepID=UPI003D93ABFC
MSLFDQMPSGSAEITERRLLQSIVEVARHVFRSAAASIFLVDETTGELVFEAVSGEGEQHLLGTRFPPGTGIAGSVAASGQPMIVDDVAETAQFAHDAAESTGYVPRSIMAAPLIRYEECIGVLEVLDRSPVPAGPESPIGPGGPNGSGSPDGSRGSRGSNNDSYGSYGARSSRGELDDVSLLALLATQAACGLELLLRLRHATSAARPGDIGGPGDIRLLLEGMAARIPRGTATANPAALKLLLVADELLG